MPALTRLIKMVSPPRSSKGAYNALIADVTEDTYDDMDYYDRQHIRRQVERLTVIDNLGDKSARELLMRMSEFVEASDANEN